jgi:PAS domain S-box-containing protein
VTDYFYELFDLDQSAFQDQALNILELLKNRLTADQMAAFTRSVGELRNGREHFEQKIHIHWKDTEKHILLRAESIDEQEQVKKIRGILKEIDPSPEQDQNAQLLLNNTQTMICWVNPDGSLAYVNQALRQALGYSEKQLEEEITIFQIDIEHTRSQWNAHRTKLKEENSITMETIFQRADGTIFPVSLNVVQLEGTVIGLLAQDISLRRQEEAQLKAGLLQINQLSQQLEAENLYLQEEVSHHFEDIISKSKAYAEVLHQVEQVAPTDSTVLIEGESGTGKELIAHSIHRLSRRSQRVLVKVNCAVLPESLIESELFGHEKGAFTGADKRRQGRFELADGGTIFLDEIGELPLDIQAKLLRVLQEGEFERVGGNTTLTVNVRIIAATNRKLKQMVNQKKFREDLYYRLNVFPIENIPLRKRTDDIPLLAQHFLKKFSIKTGKQISGITPKDMKRLQQYNFPGNVRELENIIERAVILTRGDILDLSYWKPDYGSTSAGNPEIKTMEQMQQDLIVRTLKKTHWRVSGPDGAAALLDMHPQTLYSRMRKLGIKREK